MGETKIERCWPPLLRRPLKEASSHSRPIAGLGTGATSLVKHTLLSVYRLTGELEGIQSTVSLLFSGVFITFTIVGVLALILLTWKLFSTPPTEGDCELQSMFYSLQQIKSSKVYLKNDFFFRRYIYIYTILDVFVSHTPLVSHNYIKQSVEPPKSRTLAHTFLFFLIWNFNFFTYKHSVFCIICFNVLEMLLSFRARVVVRASDGKWGQKLRLRQNESRWALSSYRIILTQFSPIVKEQGFIQ